MTVEDLLKDRLAAGDRFVVTVEYTVPDVGDTFADDVAKIAEFVGADDRVAGMALTDRVPSLTTHDTVDLAVRAKAISGKMPMVHISGKNRDRNNFREQIQRLIDNELDSALIITGDEPRSELPDSTVLCPGGFMDSVQGIDLARTLCPEMFLGAGVSSFKYSAAAQTMQYMKMRKKIDRGANAIFNQVGLDMRKVQEWKLYATSQNITTPLIQALYWPTAMLAKLALADSLPGVVATDAMHAFLKGLSSNPDKGKGKRMEILALQIALSRAWGLTGVHVGGLKNTANIKATLDLADELHGSKSADELWQQWQAVWTDGDGRPVATAPAGGHYVFQGDGQGLNSEQQVPADSARGASLKYRLMHGIHATFFDKRIEEGRSMWKLCRFADRHGWTERLLYGVERACKYPLVTCQGCGSCSLPETAYVCIQADCAKHLPNGPCGGSKVGDECEVKRGVTCAWVKIYRQANRAGTLAQVGKQFVPTKDPAINHTCSWINMALKRDHRGGEDSAEGSRPS